MKFTSLPFFTQIWDCLCGGDWWRLQDHAASTPTSTTAVASCGFQENRNGEPKGSAQLGWHLITFDLSCTCVPTSNRCLSKPNLLFTYILVTAIHHCHMSPRNHGNALPLKLQWPNLCHYNQYGFVCWGCAHYVLFQELGSLWSVWWPFENICTNCTVKVSPSPHLLGHT